MSTDAVSAGQRSPHLVSASWLAERLGDPDLRLFDCTGKLVPDPKNLFRSESARARYDAGHLPGAGYLDLHEELSDPEGLFLYTVPSAERFAAAMSRHGVGPGTFVVLYSADRVSWATRVWWMLRLFGFEEVAVLDGGLEAWTREGRPLTQEPASYAPATFTARVRPELLATKEEVARNLDAEGFCLVNALSEKQHSGEDAVHYGRRGHIPGSRNAPYLDLLDPVTGTFLPPAELRGKLREVGALDAPTVATYCGGGIGATAVAFALALVGRDDVKVYDGSMLEWAADRTLPVSRERFRGQ